MKKYNSIILFVMLFNIASVVYSQDFEQSNVSTPAGNTVIAYEYEEMSNFLRSYWDDYWEDAYPDAEILDTYGWFYSSTHRFNCHGYAWYMTSDQGDGLDDPRWIGKDTGNEDEWIYWEDESYAEVSAEAYPGKVSWDPALGGDHSAITTGSSGTFISKWAYGPLAEHDWEDCPFSTEWDYADLKFYKLCYEKIENITISSDLTENTCGYIMENITISNDSDVDISFDEYVKIEGTFYISNGSTLTINPN